ncbi:RNA polymerase sigma factor [Chitinophaga sancti]|uniref:RNA polymerase sigma-70 factor, ECF subfamily n=1 Tax=Chitinophaga sancti TaxID=1004 RepID=A0A1K1SNW4_9BACT|nr:sigma-70 family RNA polymerase sigma factor [Chitinophaga sancti]WQD60068.1 sigma-70 family RNA polymerase sigma factor [Chitinophaga sancti]WQG87803.1 sigma-70 family RNA polymerase sigma factor [Chitinophaga sancti]SFW85759.1 RNA polymerase sigma-70 factor, ECF subfamily [Chitinophaga sancti]
MATDEHAVNKLIPHLFRQEYAKMTAVLSRYFGWQYIDVAEDIASETFLKATEYWLPHGIPANPSAWLYAVARNKAKDYLKRNQLFETKIKDAIKPAETATDIEFEFNDAIIADSQLSMIFVVCDPINPAPAQICLALQILCGFSVEEIANAFLSQVETIKKRLLRARANLRTEGFQLRTLSHTEISTRLDVVLKTIYLLFNEGYFSQGEKEFIRKDLCSEAIRLTLLLAENNLTNIPRVNALLALMCYQSSRLNARTNDAGEAILYEDQDRDLWDPFLIEKGNYYFWKAFVNQEVSTYHLEAAIAYWHTTRTGDKWPQILQLYNQLLIMEYSPVSAINRTFAFAMVYGNEQAIKEAEKLDLRENSYYHGLMGFLYSGMDSTLAIAHYQQALALTRSLVEKQVFTQKIAQLANSF